MLRFVSVFVVCLIFGNCGAADSASPAYFCCADSDLVEGDNVVAVDDILVSDEPVSLAPPHVAGDYLLIPNPSRDTVSIVHSRDFSIKTIAVGANPQSVFAIDGSNTFAVHNVDDATVSKIDAAAGTQVAIPLRGFMNAVAIDSQAGFGIGYVDRERLSEFETNADEISLVEITVFSLASGTSTTMSLGEPVSAIRFGSDGEVAVVVTPTQIFHIQLANLAVTRIGFAISIIEIIVTPGGDRVFARLSDASLLAMELPHATTTVVALPGVPTDIEIDQERGLIYGVATSNGTTVIFQLTVATLAVTSMVLPEQYSSLTLSPEGTRAILFDQSTSRNDIMVVDFGSFPASNYWRRSTINAIEEVTISADGQQAIVEHQQCTCVVDSFYRGYETLSLVSIAREVLTPIRLDAAYYDMTISQDSRFGFARTDQQSLIALDLETHLHRLLPTDNEIVFVGSLATSDQELGRVYASQEHPLGRLSIHTITNVQSDIEHVSDVLSGFELNATLELNND